MPENFLHPSDRYRLYFDETGNGDLKSAANIENERYLSLTGLVIRQDTHDGYVTRRLNKLKSDIFGRTDIVFHRRELMAKKGAFEPLADPLLEMEFNHRIAALIAELSCPAFTVSIDKKALLERYSVWHYSPYHYVMECLAERFVLWLRSHNRQGDVLGEARSELSDKLLRRSYRRFFTNGTRLRPNVIQRHLTTPELKLEEKSGNVAGLQIADLLAHPCHRSYKHERLGSSPPDDFGNFIATLTLKRLHNRNPNTNSVEGYGRKWLP